MEVRSDWASLLPDLIQPIAARVLAADVVGYMSMRAVCASWRASTPSPRDPTLRDARLRPRDWVALCDGDGVRPADACEVAFISTTTGRCVRARLPELRGHRIIDFTDGLLILLNKGTTAVRVLHPFTRVAVDLPPIAPILDSIRVKDQVSRTWLRAAVCMSEKSPDSIAVVAWFPVASGVVVAEPSSTSWYIVHHSLQLASAVPFQGRLYGVIRNGLQVLQIYPECPDPCIARFPMLYLPENYSIFLLESAARLVLVLRHFSYDNPTEGYGPFRFALFEVGTAEQRGIAVTPLSSLGGRALFLGRVCCLSVSANNLPSISGDAIYYFNSQGLYPLLMYSVSSGTCDHLSTLSIIHDFKERIRPSVRPFTLADHLFTFCSHRCWSRGLMFHEYHWIPTSWKYLSRKHRAQDREVHFPSSRGLSC